MTPLDLGVSDLPMWLFVVVHSAILLICFYFSFKTKANMMVMWGFMALVVGEILYLLYHFEVFTFLLSHTLAEVMVLLAAIMIFMGLKKGPGMSAM